MEALYFFRGKNMKTEIEHYLIKKGKPRLWGEVEYRILGNRNRRLDAKGKEKSENINIGNKEEFKGLEIKGRCTSRLKAPYYNISNKIKGFHTYYKSIGIGNPAGKTHIVVNLQIRPHGEGNNNKQEKKGKKECFSHKFSSELFAVPD